MSTELLKLDENQLINLLRFILLIKHKSIENEKIVIQKNDIGWWIYADTISLPLSFEKQSEAQEVKGLIDRILKVL